VAAILAVARVRSGAVRHAAWAAVLAAMLLMPLLPRLTPALGVTVPMPAAAESAPPIPDLPRAPLMPSVLALAQVQPALSTAPIPAPAPHPPAWPIALVTVYAAGLLLLLLRMAAGWSAACHIRRSAEPAFRAAGVPAAPAGRRERLPGPLAFQSPLVASPVTIGILAPRIVLPLAWPTWPGAKLRAVLAHESAHVRRRDTLVSFVAHLNRCLFWFHPLAWWLERQLAITAEHACDEAAIRATGHSREYAQVLVDFAETALRSGGRLSLQGAGMDNAGPLEGRISHILRGDLARSVSRPRKAAVAIACAAAIFLAAACQPSRDTLVAKAEARQRQDKERSVRSASYWKAQSDRQRSAALMTPEQAAALEAGLVTNPDDLESHRTLLAYHMRLFTNAHANTDELAAVRREVLWMIGHHPEELPDSLPTNAAVFGARGSGTSADPEGYARARSLWLQQADRDGQPPAVYANAAQFFAYADPRLAERMLLRAQAADPKGESLHGMYGDNWSMRLGAEYAQALSLTVVRKDGLWNGFFPSNGADQAAYADEVRNKLAQSQDTTLLLTAAGTLLMVAPAYDPRYADRFSIGKAAVERALQLDPKSTWARQFMNKVHDQELLGTLPRAVWEGTPAARYQAIESLPEGDRFRELSLFAISIGGNAAAKYAREALDLAPKVRNHPDYGTAFFRANMVLGMAALSAGDAKAAASYLLKAADAPATDELRYPMAGERPWTNLRFPDALTTALLKAGERDAVAKFLDRYAKLCVTQHETALEDAALIRSGKTPAWSGL
jgi:hypothetical protein